MFQDAFQVLVLCFGVESDFFQRCNASLDITSYQLCMYMLEMSIIYLTYLCILEFVWKDTYHSMVHVAYLVRTGLYIVFYCIVSCSSSEFFTRTKEMMEIWAFPFDLCCFN